MICPHCRKEFTLPGLAKMGRIMRAIKKEKEIWRPWQTNSIPERWATDSTNYSDCEYKICYT